ncbi:MAG: hypothetical protein AAF368_00380 [Planctomycetota bacterium]
MFRAVFLVFGFLWLKEMPRRARSDWHEFRHSDEPMDRLVIASIWGIALYFLVAILVQIAEAAAEFATL